MQETYSEHMGTVNLGDAKFANNVLFCVDCNANNVLFTSRFMFLLNFYTTIYVSFVVLHDIGF